MKAWWIQFWGNLETREKQALWVLAGSVLLYLAYMGYASLSHATIQAEKALLDKERTRVLMQEAKEKLKPALTHQTVLADNQIQRVISASLKKASFDSATYELTQKASGVWVLVFDSVPYEAFLRWLWNIETHYRIEIQVFDVEKTTSPGLVKLNIQLQF